jgi:hypothetical protein
MTTLGTIRTIPGRGGQLGEVVALRGLPQPSGTATQSGSADGRFAPRPVPATLSLKPLSPASANGDIPNTANTDSASTGTSGTAANTPFPGTANTALVTIIQQVDPRSLPASDSAAPETDIDTDQTGDNTSQNDANAPKGDSVAQSNAQSAAKTAPTPSRPAPDGAPELLNANQQAIVEQLQARDANVRAEEESHQTLAGANAGMITYSYTTGPDGRLYATGGHVAIRPLQGLEGINAIANQAAISRAASVPGTSAADFSAARGAARNMSSLIAATAMAAAQSYQQASGLGPVAPNDQVQTGTGSGVNVTS